MINFAGSAQLILHAVEDAAVSAAVVLPSRRYVSAGGAVFDCEQVSVSCITTNTGVVSPVSDNVQVTVGQCSVTWNSVYEVAIVLCSNEKFTGPKGNTLPTPAQITADAIAISQMSDVLGAAAETLAESGEVGNITVSMAYGQPSGGYIGVVATITANDWV